MPKDEREFALDERVDDGVVVKDPRLMHSAIEHPASEWSRAVENLHCCLRRASNLPPNNIPSELCCMAIRNGICAGGIERSVVAQSV